MEIGSKIKRLRVRLGLTQEELAARTELTKGFISQLERDITSPSIATLMDILEALGTNVSEFFSDREADAVAVYTAEDMFIKEDEEAGVTIRWLVTNAQTLSSRFNAISTQLTQQKETINNQLSSMSDQVNQLTASIASLNKQISQVQGASGAARTVSATAFGTAR